MRRATNCGAILLATIALLVCGSCAPRPVTSRPAATAAAPSRHVSGVPHPGPNPAPTLPPPRPHKPGAVTIGWVGDTTPGSKYGLAPQGGRALFSAVHSALAAPDIMVTNLEGTFGSGGKSKETTSATSYVFQAPPSYAKALSWAGFDVVNLANNHTYDYRDLGLASTLQALASADVTATGLAGQITIVTRRGLRVAFIGASPYWWTQSVNDISDTAHLVKRAYRQADIVVVLMHVGAEGADKTRTPKGAESAFGESRGSARQFAHAMIDAGASAVLGSGPHVLRGMESYRGRLIAYSLGDFAGWGNFHTNGTYGLSGLLTIRINGDGAVLGGRWTSLRLRSSGAPYVDDTGASLALVRSLSHADFKNPWPVARNGTLGAGK